MSTKNPITVVINRPHGDPVRLRQKGKPSMYEDGNVVLRCLDEKNHIYWLSITPGTLRQMMEVVGDQS